MIEKKDSKNLDLIETLFKHVNKLYKLLAYRQTGHFSWVKTVLDEWKVIAELWSKPEEASLFSIEYLFHDKWYTASFNNHNLFTSHKAAEDCMKNNKGFLPLRVQGYAKISETKK